MEDLKAFRRYYNDHLHSKLVRFERQRWFLLVLIAFGIIILLTITLSVISTGMTALLLFLPIPFWLFYEIIRRQVKQYKKLFKPLVVQSILNFIDPRLKYYPDQYVPYDSFNRSNIFPMKPAVYLGEDYIIGKIGEVSFEMCELHIQHPSYIKGRLEKLFDGIFFHANFNYNSKGRIIIIPRQRWQRFIRTMKNITRYGGYEIKETGNTIFDEAFLVYADPRVHYKEILTTGLLTTINNYYIESKKEIYASFVDNHFYMAIAEPYQLLDAHVFTSNIDFDLIAAYYQELYVFTKLVEDFDIMH